MQPADYNFVISGWCKKFIQHSTINKLVERYNYVELHRLIDRALKSSKIKTLVACAAEYDDLLLAFLCFDLELNCVHFAYTKSQYRRCNIINMLAAAAKINIKNCNYSHHTIYSRKLFGDASIYRPDMF